ncbi:MAG: hydrogenase expression/formation protein HypE, partial [Planctomycetes bacterium]|nr:hydrogenase expression/formation protein HypE [Planctomycetota bacterium]
KGDGAYAISAGVGVVPIGRHIDDACVRPGDRIVVSGPLGDHGATVMAARHGMAGEALVSDAAPLTSLIAAVFAGGVTPHSMHDPTRGGLATTLNEVAGRAGVAIEVEEARVPIRESVTSVCDLLGLDPLYLACEGRVIFVVAPEDEARLLNILSDHPHGQGAATVGRVLEPRGQVAPVWLQTEFGGSRPLDLLTGMNLPRIC